MSNPLNSPVSLRVAAHLSLVSPMYLGLLTYSSAIRRVFYALFENMVGQIDKQREGEAISQTDIYKPIKYHAILYEGFPNAPKFRLIKSVEFVEYEIHGIGSSVRRGIFARHTSYGKMQILSEIIGHAKTNPLSLSAPWPSFHDIDTAREAWDAIMEIATDEKGPILVVRDCNILGFNNAFSLEWTQPVEGFANCHFDDMMKELHPTTGSPLVPIRLYEFDR